MTSPRTPDQVLNAQELRHFFISHLHRIYCAKSQLVEKLPEIGKRSYYTDLKQAIDETVEIVQNQISRMKEIYIRLDAFYQPESCTGLIGILDETFQSIGDPLDSAAVRDLSILFYMQNIESIEMASFKMLTYVADKLEQPGIAQLLMECYDEAKGTKPCLKRSQRIICSCARLINRRIRGRSVLPSLIELFLKQFCPLSDHNLILMLTGCCHARAVIQR